MMGGRVPWVCPVANAFLFSSQGRTTEKKCPTKRNKVKKEKKETPTAWRKHLRSGASIYADDRGHARRECLRRCVSCQSPHSCSAIVVSVLRRLDLLPVGLPWYCKKKKQEERSVIFVGWFGKQKLGSHTPECKVWKRIPVMCYMC